MVTEGDHTFNMSSNSSADDFSYSEYSAAMFWDTLMYVIIAVLSFSGNATVIVLICARKELRKKSSPNWFVLSLAISDLCVGGLYGPSKLICETSSFRCTVHAWNAIHNIQSVFLFASVLNLCVLTFDRYLAVVHPFTYQTFMRFSRAIKLIIFSWAASIISNIPLMVLLEINYGSRYIHTLVHMVFCYTLPTAFMIYAYSAIFIVVRRHKSAIEKHEMQLAVNFQNIHNDEDNQDGHRHERIPPNARHSRHTKDGTMRAVGVIVVVFSVCSGLFQYMTICNLAAACTLSADSNLYEVTFILLHFKSGINFVVYALLRKDFRTELRKMCRC